MRLKRDLEHLHATHQRHFGYLDITLFNCPPFVMFTNANDCAICDFQVMGKAPEPESTHIWSNLVRRATSIFDIGTRCGEYSLIAAALRQDAPIMSCEPNPDGFARLLVNMIANDVKNMTPQRVAVADYDGAAKFGWMPKFLGHISSGGRLIGDVQGGTQVSVRAATLDGLTEGLDLGNRPVMKIDVEGGEVPVFKGMPRLLASKPDIILETFSVEACAFINQLTKPLGYNYFFIDEENRTLSQRDCLYPANTDSYNQLLSTHPPDELLSFSSQYAAI